MTVEHEALASILAQWNEAGANWDGDRLAALFTPDALFFGSTTRRYVGREIREYYGLFPVKMCRFDFSDMASVVVDASTVASCGTLLLSQSLVSGKQLKVKLRLSLVMVKKDGHWKILQHHVAPTRGFTGADLETWDTENKA